MENLLKNLEELREKIIVTMAMLDIEKKRVELADLRIKANKPDFWNNQAKAVATKRKIEELVTETGDWDKLLKETKELEDLVTVDIQKGELTLAEEVNIKYRELKARLEGLEFYVLFSGKYDQSNAIVSVHAGTGGVDAQDWAEILERMYLRFAEKRNWWAEIIDRNVGNEAGIKSVTFKINGRWSYGYLKSENGVHRLVRISPFDAEAMRHTSFALVEVIPELPEAEDIEIKEEDLRIDVFRSSGPGGQSVNTTDSAVRIVHQPTNIVVTCQNERSQHQNKENALKILKAKLAQRQIVGREKEELKMRGEAQKAEWGKQIRSYVMQPYKMVKDHRTGYETRNIEAVLDGDLEKFMEKYLYWLQK